MKKRILLIWFSGFLLSVVSHAATPLPAGWQLLLGDLVNGGRLQSPDGRLWRYVPPASPCCLPLNSLQEIVGVDLVGPILDATQVFATQPIPASQNPPAAGPDLSAALQRQLDTLPLGVYQGGGEILIPDGRWSLTTQIRVPGLGVTIRCSNNRAGVLVSSVPDYAFVVGSWGDVAQSVEFIGCGLELADPNGRGILFIRTRRSVLDRMRIHALAPAQGPANRTVGVTYTDLTVQGSLDPSEFTGFHRVQQSSFLGLWTGVDGAGIVTASSFVGNEFSGPFAPMTPPATAFWFSAQSHGNLLTGNNLEGWDFGLDITGFPQLVIGNRFERNAMGHIRGAAVGAGLNLYVP